jgi:molybdopterin-binding protein
LLLRPGTRPKVGLEEKGDSKIKSSRSIALARYCTAIPKSLETNKMKISARNVLEGTIREIRKGATTTHVAIEVKGGEVITASITNEAVEELDSGTDAYAVIKASDVMIAVK